MKMSKTMVATALSFMMLGTGALGVAAQHPGASPQHAFAAASLAQPGTKTAPQSAACAADQKNGATEANETANEQENANETENSSAKENTAADPDNLQCGDQQQDSQSHATNGSQALAAPGHGTVTFLRAQVNPAATAQAGASQAENGAENEQAAETETGATNDQATDGVACDQQGQHEGNNTGC